MKESMKLRITPRSVSRPAISLSALLHVARKSVRARVCKGRDTGVEGGVEKENRKSNAVLTDAVVDTDACRLTSFSLCQQSNEEAGGDDGLPCLARGEMISVPERRKARGIREATGEGSGVSSRGEKGGTFSLFPSPSKTSETRGRLGRGVESGVWSWSADLDASEPGGGDSTCCWWPRLPRTELRVTRTVDIACNRKIKVWETVKVLKKEADEKRKKRAAIQVNSKFILRQSHQTRKRVACYTCKLYFFCSHPSSHAEYVL